MKVSYGEGIACLIGPKSCVEARKGIGEALITEAGAQCGSSARWDLSGGAG